MADPFGRALLDCHRDEQTEALTQRDGETVLRHPVQDFYFGAFADEPAADWVDARLSGPVLDVGAGAGRDTLFLQQDRQVVALEHTDALVTLLSERGVDRVVRGDMFSLPFGRDRFESVLAVGTQVGLARSMAGLRSLLSEFASVTTPDGTAIIDGYDPTFEGASDILGFRSDPTPGLAFRVLRYEYDGLVGDTLLFRLFSPEKLRDVTTGTRWRVAEVRRPHDSYYYRAALDKR